MSNEVDLIDKLATAYQPLTKVVSDLGASLQKIERVVVRQETKLEDYTAQVSKMLDSHDVSIKSLDEAKTTIFSSIATTKWVAGLLLTVITTMGVFIVTSWSHGYDERLNKIELERKETLDKVFQLLAEQKKLLNQSELKDIIANIYRRKTTG